MKRVLILALSLLCLLTACQPTPEKPFVIQNDQEKMLETAQRTAAPKPDTTAAEQPNTVDFYDRLGAPRTFQKKLSGTGGRLQVEADAEVILPDAELPIVRVTPDRFDREKLLMFADALLPEGAAFVTPMEMPIDEEKTYYLRAKGYYVRIIQLMQWSIDHWDEGGSDHFDNDDSTRADVEKRLAEVLYEQSLAPERMPRVAREDLRMDGWWQATVDDMTLFDILLLTNPWDGTVERLEYRRDSLQNPNVCFWQNIPNDIPRQQAEAAAVELVQKLPMGDFTLAVGWPEAYDDYGDDRVPCWRFCFTRSFGRVSETISNAACTREEGYNHQRNYEKLLVTVDKDGVAGVRYDAPYAVGETLTEKTSLLPFATIEEIFDKMILVYHNTLNDGTRDKSHWTYYIQTVRLGLVNIPEKNSENGLLVPAWTFLGYIHYESPYEDDYAGTNGLKPFLTINAVDGSIIDREG